MYLYCMYIYICIVHTNRDRISVTISRRQSIPGLGNDPLIPRQGRDWDCNPQSLPDKTPSFRQKKYERKNTPSHG